MSAVISRPESLEIDYPTSDGKLLAETELHRKNMTDTIEALDIYFVEEPMVCVSGNLLMYYVPGDKHKHISPDVFVGVHDTVCSCHGVE